ncbi:Protein kinase domain [Arabidopsis thaliana x Arabidopsis arenosa]|uniref:Protein kinase domain n=1 Tax=Arabidopsis thaliana x Arabidopsis arenosa TaxID=1240361 RepID=A0A8T1XMW7_9BRAS|nr:Protein kinase domain [Arabidopsis thaliana x Arabidopsis arenosa]
MRLKIFPFLVLFFFFCFNNNQSWGLMSSNQQPQFFKLMKNSLSGYPLSSWNVTDVGGTYDYCSFTGVRCDGQGLVTDLDLSGLSLSGIFPEGICSYLPNLRVLRLSHNHLNRSSSFLNTIPNCSLLQELNMSSVYLKGTLPDFSPMKSLRVIDMSWNHFTGSFPISIFNLTDLEYLNFNENPELDLWTLPDYVSKLTKLTHMLLMTCMLHGNIPRSIGNLSSLVDLELSGNFLSGEIPKEIGNLSNLRQLELYYNYHLTGSIPEEIGNLKNLTDIDISVSRLTGSIPDSICSLPKLRVLQLYNNSLTGEIPKSLGNSKTLKILSLYDNYLTGELPPNLGSSSPMIALDVSENRLSGPLPAHVCKSGKLLYFLVLQNLFTGSIPETYGSCKTLIRFRVASNRLVGFIPQGVMSLPHVSIIDLAYNSLSGPIPNAIGNAWNLSELFMQGNRISGVLPHEISHATNLVKLDLSNNQLSGPIPSEIGRLRKLNLLVLQGNHLDSSIPESLSNLKSLNVLDLSSNLLTGRIPEDLSELLPTSINFSSNRLSGPIPVSLIRGGLVESFSDNPNLCVPPTAGSSDLKFPMCQEPRGKKKLSSIWAILVSVFILVLGGIMFYLRQRMSKNRAVIEQDETLASSFFSYDVKSFHRISFDQREILEALVDKNIVGHGGSGTVYRVEFKSGEVVAVKKLWSQSSKDSASEDKMHLNKELKTEVETLGSIRHKNIVKLFSYFSSLDCSLLVYEYMPNGNLWDALHKGFVHLEWRTRHQIAVGVAQGLAYLHHDLSPPIIHRDIKSTNILLDVNYQPKVADFGIAKVLQARGKDSTTTVMAGTYGYLAPEYAYSSKATIKCDVYSFGVVLMELITGKKPVDSCFGENKNIVNWVSTKIDTKEGLIETLDKRLSESSKADMINALRVAIRCTSRTPTIRPTMNEVVQLLIDAAPQGGPDMTSKSTTKIKDSISDHLTQTRL